MQVDYFVGKTKLSWDGSRFHVEVEVQGEWVYIDDFSEHEGWELVSFFPDAHAIGDIEKGYKDGRDGWVPPDQRVAIFKREKS
jgi:hypothetical protein